MAAKVFTSIFCLALLGASTVWAGDRPLVDFGRWSEAELAQILTESRRVEDSGERVAALSRHFLGSPYVGGTLVGDPQTTEQLVVNLACFDCFTLLDAVEALRRAASVADFPGELQRVRYRGGQVAYASRRHFFSDWVAGDGALVADVTAAVGQGRARVAVKDLNRKSDGTLWLPGIAVTRREITYIPARSIDRELLSALQAGDYVGIYSERAGLDVSHVGVVVAGQDGPVLRHASSRSNLMRVVDVDLLEYLQGIPGLVVYRVR